MKNIVYGLLINALLLTAGCMYAMEHADSDTLRPISNRTRVERTIDQIINQDNMVCNVHATTCLVLSHQYGIDPYRLHFFNGSRKFVGAYDVLDDGSLVKQNLKNIIPLDSNDSWIDEYRYSDSEGIFKRACLFDDDEFDFGNIKGVELSSEEILLEKPSLKESIFAGIEKVKQGINYPGKHIGRYCSIKNKWARYGISAALYSTVICGVVKLYKSCQEDEDDDIGNDSIDEVEIKDVAVERNEIVDQKVV